MLYSETKKKDGWGNELSSEALTLEEIIIVWGIQFNEIAEKCSKVDLQAEKIA